MQIKKNGETVAEPILPLNSACISVDANGDTKIECFSIGSDTFEISLASHEADHLHFLLWESGRRLSHTQDNRAGFNTLSEIGTDMPETPRITHSVAPAEPRLSEYTPDWDALMYDHVRQDVDGAANEFRENPEYNVAWGMWESDGSVNRIGKFRPPVNAQLASWDRPVK